MPAYLQGSVDRGRTLNPGKVSRRVGVLKGLLFIEQLASHDLYGLREVHQAHKRVASRLGNSGQVGKAGISPCIMTLVRVEAWSG